MTRSSRKAGARRRAPVSIRLTESEIEALTGLADGLPLSTYIKQVLFGKNALHRRAPVRLVAPDQKLLAQILARLGTYGRGPSLTRLANLAEHGAFYCDEHTLAQLRLACDDVAAIRADLMRALQKKPELADVSDDFGGVARGRTFQ